MRPLFKNPLGGLLIQVWLYCPKQGFPFGCIVSMSFIFLRTLKRSYTDSYEYLSLVMKKKKKNESTMTKEKKTNKKKMNRLWPKMNPKHSQACQSSFITEKKQNEYPTARPLCVQWLSVVVVIWRRYMYRSILLHVNHKFMTKMAVYWVKR